MPRKYVLESGGEEIRQIINTLGIQHEGLTEFSIRFEPFFGVYVTGTYKEGGKLDLFYTAENVEERLLMSRQLRQALGFAEGERYMGVTVTFRPLSIGMVQIEKAADDRLFTAIDWAWLHRAEKPEPYVQPEMPKIVDVSVPDVMPEMDHKLYDGDLPLIDPRHLTR